MDQLLPLKRFKPNTRATPHVSIGGLVSLESIESQIENGQSFKDADGTMISLFDLVPDQMISNYPGKRFIKNDFTFGVCSRLIDFPFPEFPL